jgi:hypothetical protein
LGFIVFGYPESNDERDRMDIPHQRFALIVLFRPLENPL